MDPVFNQTQFSSEEPLLYGKAELPPEQLSEEELQTLRMKSKKQKKQLALIIGSLLILVAAIILITSMVRPSRQVSQQPAKEGSPSPTPSKLTLREEIDQLILQVNKANRASRNLVFPPVNSEITIELD